jgi:hypothetical protein
MSFQQRRQRQELHAERQRCLSKGRHWSELRGCVPREQRMITGAGSMGGHGMGHGMMHMGKRKSKSRKTCHRVRVKAHKSKTVKGRRISVRSHKRRIC